MNISMTVFNASGEITKVVNCPEYMQDLQLAADEDYIEGPADPATQYVSNGALADKTALPYAASKTTLTADGIDSIVISSLPIPSTVVLEGELYTVEDGTFEFSVDLPGTYTVNISSLHCIPTRLKVVAT